MVEYHRRLCLSPMIAILAILILFPSLKDEQTGRLAISLLFLVVMLHAPKVLAPRRHVFRVGFALAMAAGVGLPALMLVVKLNIAHTTWDYRNGRNERPAAFLRMGG